MIAFEYIVTSMLSYPQYESEKDVVFKVYFDYIGSETLDVQSQDPITKQPITIQRTFTSKISNDIDLTYQSGTPFTPYNQLTNSQVVSWIESSVNPDVVSAWQTVITNNINEQINPTEQQLPLPWQT
jgi:hypothetical protein